MLPTHTTQVVMPILLTQQSRLEALELMLTLLTPVKDDQEEEEEKSKEETEEEKSSDEETAKQIPALDKACGSLLPSVSHILFCSFLAGHKVSTVLVIT